MPAIATAEPRSTSAAPGPQGQAPRGRRVVRSVVPIIIGLTLAALLSGGLYLWQRSGLPGLSAPDKFFYDWRQVLLARQEADTRREFAILAISDETLAEYSAQAPIDRSLLAKVVTALNGSGARVIGIDVPIDRATDPAKDAELAAAIRAAGDRVVVGVIDSRSAVPVRNLEYQRAFLTSAGNPRTGHLYFDRKRTGIGQPDLAVRWMARRADKPGLVKESFAEALLAAAKIEAREIGQSHIEEGVEVGPHIDWLGLTAANGAATFTMLDVPSVPAAAATPDTLVSPAWREVIAGRIVVIGGRFDDRDRHLTPLSVQSGARMTGAEIHTQIAAQLKDGRRLKTLRPLHEWGLGAAIAFIGFLLGYARRMRGSTIDYVLVGVAVAGAGALAFMADRIILPSDTMFYSALASVFIGHNGPKVIALLRRRWRQPQSPAAKMAA